MADLVRRFAAGEDGATAIEYGLIAAFLGVGLILAFTTFGSSLVGLFGHVQSTAGAAIDSAS
jgi:pilus assembly protein Flp/PilA